MNKLDFTKIKGKLITFEKDDVIFEENELCTNITCIIKGEVTISTSSALYNEFVISTLSDGEVFGENILFSNNPYYLGTVYANKKTIIKMISKNNYLQFIQENLESFLYTSCTKHLMLQQRTKILLQKSIREKILFFLISKANISKSNIIKIKTKKDLSKYLNIERPSLSRELSLLKKDKIIDYTKHEIILLKSQY